MKLGFGLRQLMVLDYLNGCAGQRWHNNGSASGWAYGSANETERILDSLVKKGIVTKDKDGWYSPAEEKP